MTYQEFLEQKIDIAPLSGLEVSEQELNSRATKAARQEAKRLKKDGWLVSPGALPMDKQLDKAYKMQFEYDDNAFPKYLMGEAMSTGQNYDAAKVQALELAKLNLAGQVQTEITALVENTVSNSQLDAGEASSIVETVNASKNVISQSLGRVIPVMECYRKTRNGNTEVLVRIAYNSQMAINAAKNAVKQSLEEKGNNLHEQLDKALGL